MRLDKKTRHERLCILVKETISEILASGNECDFEGFQWAVRPLADWAELLDVSVDTVTDLIKIPPIQRTYTQVEGKRAVLLRVGDPGPLTDREIANFMKKRFRAATGRNPTPKHWAMLKGLASKWPDGAQVQIFQTVLEEWPTFIAGVKFEIDEMIESGAPAQHAWHKYPSISVMLRFHKIAIDLYIMKLQATGAKPPPSVVALNPELWHHFNGS
jgi:hypothetical protein